MNVNVGLGRGEINKPKEVELQLFLITAAPPVGFVSVFKTIIMNNCIRKHRQKWSENRHQKEDVMK